MKTLNRSLSFIALCLVSSISAAAIVNFSTTIDGAQANAGAGTGSPATGTGTFTLDTETNEFNWDISFSGLLSAQTNAHIHGPAAPGVDAGVQIALGVGSPDVSTVGTILGADQAADLLADLWYVNIHTVDIPAGEIRGQILSDVSAVPVPAAFWLFGSGLVGLLTVLKRKK